MMDREFYQAKGLHDGLLAAKQARKPYSVFPSEKHLLRIHDLPVVEMKEAPVMVYYLTSDSQLQCIAQTGRRYGRFSYGPNHLGEFEVGEWV